jgi:hypothetical protein
VADLWLLWFRSQHITIDKQIFKLHTLALNGSLRVVEVRCVAELVGAGIELGLVPRLNGSVVFPIKQLVRTQLTDAGKKCSLLKKAANENW